MSGRSRPRKARRDPMPSARRQTHAAPTALRLPGLRSVYDAVIGACGELAGVTNALDAELWLAANINVLRAKAPTGEVFHLAMLDLIEQAAQMGRRDCLVLLRTMAAVGPQGLMESARRAGGRLAARLPDDAVVLPHWVDLLGATSVGDCYLWTDVFGEYAQVYCQFTHRDGDRRHGLLATVDLAYRGALTNVDLVTLERDVDQVAKDMERDARRDDGHFQVITPAQAAGLIRAALDAFTDPTLPKLATGPRFEEAFYAALPSAVLRVAAMPGGDRSASVRQSVADMWTPNRRTALIDEFFAACPDGWADPPVARMVTARIVDLSVDVLGWPPDRIGPVSVARLFGEILPAALVAPEIILRQVAQVSETWVQWLNESRKLPGSAHRKLRRTALAVLTRLPRQCRDRRVNPYYPYVADLPAERAGGAELQETLDRRTFAVPYPGRRGDGMIELPRAANGLPAGQTHVDDLDAADPAHRHLITTIEQSSYGTHQERVAAYAAITEQIWNDEPREVWRAARRLAASRLPRQRILKELTETWRRHHLDIPAAIPGDPGTPSTDRYAAALQALGATPRRR